MDLNAQRDELRTLLDRVHGLRLRIQKTPQATSAIREEAGRLAEPLEGLREKLKKPPHGARLDHVETELLRIQQALQTLYAEELNPRMMQGTTLPPTDEHLNR